MGLPKYSWAWAAALTTAIFATLRNFLFALLQNFMAIFHNMCAYHVRNELGKLAQAAAWRARTI